MARPEEFAKLLREVLEHDGGTAAKAAAIKPGESPRVAPKPDEPKVLESVSEGTPSAAQGESPSPEIQSAETPLEQQEFGIESAKPRDVKEVPAETQTPDSQQTEVPQVMSLNAKRLAEPSAVRPASPGKRLAAGLPAQAELEQLVRAVHSDPFHLLGPHSVERDDEKRIAVRVFHPQAREVHVVLAEGANAIRGQKIHPAGVFEALIPYSEGVWGNPAAYRLRIQFTDGSIVEAYDTYAFPPLLTDFDLHLVGEGTHYQKYEKLGAHVREVAGVRGVHFGVWAPNARRVSVVGDFNHWDGRVNAMRSRGSSGIWEISCPSCKRE